MMSKKYIRTNMLVAGFAIAFYILEIIIFY